jgi:hypothetical protein
MLARAVINLPYIVVSHTLCAMSSAILSLKAERSLGLRPMLSLP